MGHIWKISLVTQVARDVRPVPETKSRRGSSILTASNIIEYRYFSNMLQPSSPIRGPLHDFTRTGDMRHSHPVALSDSSRRPLTDAANTSLQQ